MAKMNHLLCKYYFYFEGEDQVFEDFLWSCSCSNATKHYKKNCDESRWDANMDMCVAVCKSMYIIQ